MRRGLNLTTEQLRFQSTFKTVKAKSSMPYCQQKSVPQAQAGSRETSVTELSTHPWNDACWNWNIGGTQASDSDTRRQVVGKVHMCLASQRHW